MSYETIFDKVRFRNFQSFGNNWTEIDLSLRGLTLIIGENLDEGGSSGAGKTTAMAVICYCLYDKIPSGVSKDRMVNQTNGKKNTSMEAELYFHKGPNEYLIQRTRGAITSVHLFENGVDITPASVKAFNDKIEDLVGLSYNLFCQIVLFSGNARPFLDMSVNEQRMLIEELFKITMLTNKANALKKQASETNKQIDLLKVLIKQQELQNEGYHKRCREAAERVKKWDDNQGSSIVRLEDQLKAIKTFDFDAEETFHNEIARLEKLKNEVSSELTVLNGEYSMKVKEKPQLQAELTLMESKLSSKKREKAEGWSDHDRLVRELEQLEKDLKKIRGEMSHLTDAKCPYCLQDYAESQNKLRVLESRETQLNSDVLETARKIEEAQAAIDADEARIKKEVEELQLKCEDLAAGLEAEMLKQAEELNQVKAKVDAKKKELEDVTAEQAGVKSVITYKTLNDALKAKQSVTTIEKQLETLRDEINPHLVAVKDLMEEGEIIIDYKTLDDLVKLEQHQKFLVKLLTDKNSYVRKNLISTTTPFLNKRIGYYVEKLNLPHVVLFQPDMSCEISQLGRQLDHGNLSNGEKKRLNLAICLAFRDVLTYLHSRVNVLFTDEVDGGSLDSNCVDMLIQLLKKKSWDDDISIYVISHRPEFEGRCDRNFVVRKEQGFSQLLLQPDE